MSLERKKYQSIDDGSQRFSDSKTLTLKLPLLSQRDKVMRIKQQYSQQKKQTIQQNELPTLNQLFKQNFLEKTQQQLSLNSRTVVASPMKVRQNYERERQNFKSVREREKYGLDKDKFFTQIQSRHKSLSKHGDQVKYWYDQYIEEYKQQQTQILNAKNQFIEELDQAKLKRQKTKRVNFFEMIKKRRNEKDSRNENIDSISLLKKQILDNIKFQQAQRRKLLKQEIEKDQTINAIDNSLAIIEQRKSDQLRQNLCKIKKYINTYNERVSHFIS